MRAARKISRILLGIFFISAGAGHFIIPEFYLRIVPPFLPAPGLLVALSGVLEALLGAAALLHVTPRVTGYALIALLIAVFPANIYMAVRPDLFPDLSAGLLWARLPLQLVLVGWVLFSLPPSELDR